MGISKVFIFLPLLLLLLTKDVSSATTFTFLNKCDFTVWPGILGNSGLDTSGFQLHKGRTRSLEAPPGWSGRFWGRTGCKFDGSGKGSCSTGDCGSGQVECNGSGANPPATLAEFTLGLGSPDYYDVSLVDGFNLPMIIEASGGGCESTGCETNINGQCPKELRNENGDACRSACEAFGTPEYCCSGAYDSPSVCSPSAYSQMFKTACPKSYSYAFDDASSTFTCTDSNYIITFCPNTQRGETMSHDTKKSGFGGSWLVDLAIGKSSITKPCFLLQATLILTITLLGMQSNS